MTSTIANYQGNGSTTDFNVPFDYLAKKFVKVTVDSREKLGGDYGDTTKDYFFVDKTTIRFNTAPASGTEIIIRRYTSATDRIVSFKDASVLKAKDLDASAIQTIHIAEEGRDIINDALIVDKEGNWDAKGHRIVNVGDPIGDNDAVSLKFYKDDAMGAYQAKLKAEAARDAAKVSETNSKASEVNAKESEVTAKASAGTAVSAAKHADAVKTENQAILEEARQLQTDIETSERNAYDNAVIATQKAEEAKVSERNAKESETNAKASEVSAKANADRVEEIAGVVGVVVPVADEIRIVAENIDHVVTDSRNINNINIVGNDLEGSLSTSSFEDYGDLGNTGDALPTITGGNIKNVSDNINEVRQVGSNIEDVKKVATEINNIPETITTMEGLKADAISARDLAKDWANKTTGTVDGSEYSSKYYANKAKESATEGTTTLNEIKTEGAKQVKSITDTATTEISKITSEGGRQVGLVSAQGTTSVNAVKAQQTTSVNAVTAKGTKQVNLAKAQATIATQQATLATTKASEAEDSATAANAAATKAKASATNAANSASTSTAQATNASNSAKAAKLSEDNAALSKTAAGTSATNAKASETEAKRQADLAKGYAGQAASGQINSDWAETDSTSKAFIKNKPTLGALASKDSIAYSEITGTPPEQDLSGLATKTYVDNEVQKLDNKLESKEDLDIVVGSIPWYQRESMFTTAKRSVTVPAGTQVTINGKFYVTKTPKTVNLPSVGNGKDVYLYACESSTREPTFVISANSTVPYGYNAQNSRKIGGFHTLCANVGTVSGHSLSGYVAGDIIPYSAWDLKHRPVSEVEGMVWVAPINKWVQIYLPSWSGSKLVSRFNGVIVDGASDHKLHGEGFVYEAGLANCQLISRDEFMIAMRGVPEGVNIQGGNDPNTTGGHVATNGQRIISNYGIEDGAGVIWQWSRDCTEFYPSATWNKQSFNLSGYSWQEKPVYNPDFDTVKRGSCLGLLRRLRLGAFWSGGSVSGSRSMLCYDFSSYGWDYCSARLVAEPLAIGVLNI